MVERHSRESLGTSPWFRKTLKSFMTWISSPVASKSGDRRLLRPLGLRLTLISSWALPKLKQSSFPGPFPYPPPPPPPPPEGGKGPGNEDEPNPKQNLSCRVKFISSRQESVRKIEGQLLDFQSFSANGSSQVDSKQSKLYWNQMKV